jgi:hypothetical protein
MCFERVLIVCWQSDYMRERVGVCGCVWVYMCVCMCMRMYVYVYMSE